MICTKTILWLLLFAPVEAFFVRAVDISNDNAADSSSLLSLVMMDEVSTYEAKKSKSSKGSSGGKSSKGKNARKVGSPMERAARSLKRLAS